MHTLTHLYRFLKEHGENPFMLDVIREVVRAKLPMPHAAVWWIMQSLRLGNFKSGSGIESYVHSARRTGVREHWLYHDEPGQKGYVLECYYRVSESEYDTDVFVVDEVFASDLTRRYLLDPDFDRSVWG